MQNNLMFFHSQNHTRTHIIAVENFSDKTVNAPVEGLKINGNVSDISVSGINHMNLPYKYTFTTYVNLTSLITGLKSGVEYVFYCDRIEAEGTHGPALIIGGRSITNVSSRHTFNAGVAIKFTPSADNPGANLYSNNYDYNASNRVSATVYGMRIYEASCDPTVYYPYTAPQTVSIPYELGDNDTIELSGGRVILTQSGVSADISDTDTGIAIKNLKSTYPSTYFTGCTANVRVLGLE